MERNYHITTTGELKRAENTIKFIPDTEEKDSQFIPVMDVDAIYAHEPIQINTKALHFLSENTIELHIFTWNNRYGGTFMPEKQHISGSTVVKQVTKYKNTKHRRNIASKIVKSSIYNMERTLSYYSSDHPVNSYKKELEQIRDSVELQSIDELLGFEGQARMNYYSAISKIIPDYFSFEKRKYNPPQDEFNALVSFLNSLMYSSVLSGIRGTALDPTISYLHEPSNRRNSLALDLADIFKPVISDRIFLRVVNRKQVKPSDFKENWRLQESAKKTVLKEYEETLEETIEHKKLEKHVSYQYLLYLESLALKKHILTDEEYSAFRRWW